MVALRGFFVRSCKSVDIIPTDTFHPFESCSLAEGIHVSFNGRIVWFPGYAHSYHSGTMRRVPDKAMRNIVITRDVVRIHASLSLSQAEGEGLQSLILLKLPRKRQTPR